MCRICENHAELLNKNDESLTQQFLEHILMGLKDKPKVSSQCCSAIQLLGQNLACTNGNESFNPLTKYYKDIIEHLMINSNRDDYAGSGVDLAMLSFGAMITLVQNSGTDSNAITYELMIKILTLLEQTLNA